MTRWESRALLLCTLPSRQPHLTGPRAAGPGGAWKAGTEQGKRAPRPEAAFHHPTEATWTPSGALGREVRLLAPGNWLSL